ALAVRHQAQELFEYTEKEGGQKRTFRGPVGKLLNRSPAQREPAEIEAAVGKIDQERKRLQAEEARLGGAGPYRSKAAQELKEDEQNKLARKVVELDDAEKSLREGDKAVREKEQQFNEKYLQPLHRLARQGGEVLERKAQPLTERPPND